jgi:putative ABC transport system substrate-binding protein
MRRRNVLSAGAIGLLVAQRLSHAQPKSRIPRIGILWFGSMEFPQAARNRAVFRQRLAALGYVEGKSITIEERSADGSTERLRQLARELAASKVDVIVAPAITSARAARQATSTIPIVMLHAGDPIGAGLIASLARPGGNVTGTTNLSYAGKQVDLVRELVPGAAKLVILLNPSNANAHTYVTDAMDTGRKFNLSIAVAEVGRDDDFPNAFAMIREMRPDAILVMGDPFLGQHRGEVIAFAATARLPATYDLPDMSREGGLVAYGPLLAEHYVAGAGYVDRILKGAKASDLPVEQPARFELVINLRTAKALGLAIPQSIIVRADEVIR